MREYDIIKAYTDKVLGKSKIIAQCGYFVLVEYKSQKARLLSVTQMLETRDTTIKYAMPTAQTRD